MGNPNIQQQHRVGWQAWEHGQGVRRRRGERKVWAKVTAVFALEVLGSRV